MTGSELKKIYKTLYDKIGPRGWWPAESAFEVIVGAILAQNTAWRNVKKAIQNLKDAGLLEPRKLLEIPESDLAVRIRPSGYYNQKAKKLKNFLAYFHNHYHGDLELMALVDTNRLRGELLAINGIGPETADSILLYALQKPVFVVDAYTKRIFSRHDWVPESITYDELQAFFHERLSRDVQLFNEFHALLDYVGHFYCRKKPLCNSCPLQPFLENPGVLQLGDQEKT